MYRKSIELLVCAASVRPGPSGRRADDTRRDQSGRRRQFLRAGGGARSRHRPVERRRPSSSSSRSRPSTRSSRQAGRRCPTARTPNCTSKRGTGIRKARGATRRARVFHRAARRRGEPIRHSYGYPLPHRGVTRNDGTDTIGYSTLDRRRSGDLLEKQSVPDAARSLAKTDARPSAMGDDRSRDPASNQRLRIAWAEPFARSIWCSTGRARIR